MTSAWFYRLKELWKLPIFCGLYEWNVVARLMDRRYNGLSRKNREVLHGRRNEEYNRRSRERYLL